MGFPLPVLGYVMLRGRGARPDPDNIYNAGNIRLIEDFLDSLRAIYPRYPAPGRFFFSCEEENEVAFGEVQLEQDRASRTTLHGILFELRRGGTIVVPRMKDLLDSSDESLQLMLDYQDGRVAFLPLDALRFGRVRTIGDVDEITKVLMDVRFSIGRSVMQSQRRLGLRQRNIADLAPRDVAA